MSSWTHETPTEPGMYWYSDHEFPPEPVCLGWQEVFPNKSNSWSSLKVTACWENELLDAEAKSLPGKWQPLVSPGVKSNTPSILEPTDEVKILKMFERVHGDVSGSCRVEVTYDENENVDGVNVLKDGHTAWHVHRDMLVFHLMEI